MQTAAIANSDAVHCSRPWNFPYRIPNPKNAYVALTEDSVSLSTDIFPASSLSFLGPLLFLIYSNDLRDPISHALPFMFVNDTKCLNNIYKATNCDHLQADVDALSDWCVRNGLSFNTQMCPTTCTVFSSSPAPSVYAYMILHYQ